MIEINELNLKIPGITAQQGEWLGKEVSERVAKALPNFIENKEIGHLNLKMEAFKSNDLHFMADSISSQIIKQIKLAII